MDWPGCMAVYLLQLAAVGITRVHIEHAVRSAPLGRLRGLLHSFEHLELGPMLVACCRAAGQSRGIVHWPTLTAHHEPRRVADDGARDVLAAIRPAVPVLLHEHHHRHLAHIHDRGGRAAPPTP